MGTASFHERNGQGVRRIGREMGDFRSAARTGGRLAQPHPRMELVTGHIPTAYRGAPEGYPARFPAAPGRARDPQPSGGQ